MSASRFQKLVSRVNALQLRERVLLLIASVVLLYFLADRLGLQPLFEEQQLLLGEIKARELQFDVLSARSGHFGIDSDSVKPTSIETAQREASDVERRLQLRLDSLLSPDKAVSLLEQIMTREEGLILNSVDTRQIPYGSNEPGIATRAANGDIERYELALQLEGGYLETLHYLRALEALPWKFFWKEIEFATVDYPRASVDLEIYTYGKREH